MQTTSVKLYSLEYSEAKTYLATALFLAGNIVLPQLFHTIRLGGPTWLPIYFFTLVGAYKYGWRAGLLTALASPVANALLFGMPAAAALPAIVLKSVLLAGAAGYAAARFRRASLALLAAVVLFYRRPAHWANGPSRVRSTPPCRTSASACRACCCKSSAAGHSSIS